MYDGPYADIPRAAEQTDQTATWPDANGLRVEWAARRRPEQCDNGGLTLHGCTRLCEVDTTAAWQCRHYLRSVLLYEVPQFASRCEIMTGGGVYNWSTWAIRRRLRHDAGAGAYRSKYSVHGRMLKHIPVTTPYATLPANAFTFEKNALVLYAKAGLNGQLRVVEAGAGCALCYGAVYAY